MKFKPVYRTSPEGLVRKRFRKRPVYKCNDIGVEVAVSEHAVDRFRQRIGIEYDGDIKSALAKRAYQAYLKNTRVRNKNQIYRFRGVCYHLSNTKNGTLTLQTVYKG